MRYLASALTNYAVGPDNIRTGEAQGLLHLDPSSVAVASLGDSKSDPTSCMVQLRRLGPWLLVNAGTSENANSGCGCISVTFNGVYQRIDPARETR